MNEKTSKKRAPGGGRKAQTPGQPRDNRIDVRVSNADIAKIDAARGEKTRSTYIYDLIIRTLKSHRGST